MIDAVLVAPMTPSDAIVRTFKAMGCIAHIVIHGGTERHAVMAETRVLELESLWSRFLEDSDITRVNRSNGNPVVVHPDTLAVIRRACDGYRQTRGSFDITVLAALLEHGYLDSVTTKLPAPAIPGCRIGVVEQIELDYEASTVRIPVDGAIDLGGIGKGFAADIVSEELIESGVIGALVNIGGDLALAGSSGGDDGWVLGIEDPRNPPEHIGIVRLAAGGVATSGTTVRRWLGADGNPVHHLIEPSSGRPAHRNLLSATVLAGDSATAEIFATAWMIGGGPAGCDLLDAVGLAGVAIGADGTEFRSSNVSAFLQ